MTYLELVNNVLKRLREETVSTVNQNDYSSLVGSFVNDARVLVDDAWQWSSQKTTESFDTVANQAKYSLVGVKPRSEVIAVIDTNTNNILRYKPSQQFRKDNLVSSAYTGNPNYYTFNGLDVNGDMIIELSPAPDSIATFEVDLVKRTTELVEDSDNTYLPTNPIVQLAFAMAIQERGEVQGLSSTQQFSIGQRALQDAIALDAQYSPEELVWDSGYRGSRY